MNTDEIFISRKERDARKLEAYRLARKRKIHYQMNRALSALLMMTLFVGCALALMYKLVYVIRNVDVTGSQRYTSEEILLASGVEAGDNLYSFSSRIAENAVTLQYPYVRELDVSRKAPSTVHFTVTEDTAVFYAEIYGEMRALSSSLRVLDRVSGSDVDALGLIRLRMPEIESAMAGRVVQFREEKFARQIRETTAEILSSGLSERITSVDLRDPYQVRMVADKRFLLEFGSNADLGIKMKVASAVLADELFKTDIKAQIDLSVSDSTSVILDNQLNLDA
jgi:cell division protein FtsQ